MPWILEGNIAAPCATQNEVDEKSAKTLTDDRVQAVIEDANMPSTTAAKSVFRAADLLDARGKAVNAVGVAVSALEISQDHMRGPSRDDDADSSSQNIVSDIHNPCIEDGTQGGNVNYVKGRT